MKKKLILIISLIVFFLIEIGYAGWRIYENRNANKQGDFSGFTIIDLKDITNYNIKQAFLYNESGLFSETGLGNSTSFTIQLNATQMSEAYDLTLSLLDSDNILDGAVITSVATTEINDIETQISTGNSEISISNISAAATYLVTFTIQTDNTTYPGIYAKLNSGQDEFGLRINASTDSGTWAVDKTITLTADFQNLMPINKPSMDNTVFTYNGTEQEYHVDLSTGYTVSGNRQTNAGNHTVTISLNSGYVWSDSTSADLEYAFVINKATPVLSGTIAVTYPDSRAYGITADLGFISLSGTFINFQSSNVVGSVSLDGVSNLIVGTSNYNYVFTPTDSSNYNNVTGSVSLVIYATVNFMFDASNILQTNYVQYNGTIDNASIPSLTDSQCKTYYSNLLTYQYTPTFSNWIDFSSSTTVTTDLNVLPNITQTLRSYNFTIYYKDRDNQVSLVRTNTNEAISTYGTQVYDFASRVGATSVSNATFGTTTVSLAKQIRLAETYTYYSKADTTASRYINAFYMSPVDSFTWNDLATGYNASGYTVTTTKYIAYVNGDNVLLLVLCVQPEAIVTTGSISNSTTFNYSTSNALFFEKMNDAFNACASVTSTTYLRIYGQARYASNTFAYHCYSNNPSIAQYTYTIGGHTFTIPKYTLYALNDYKLANNFTINQYLSVILPYGRDDTTTTGYANCQSSAATYAGSYVQSIMEIPSGKTLTVNGTLNVGGWITGEGAVGAHATLRNNGTIAVNSGGKVNSFGYINGAGTISLASGSTLTDVFKIYNWPGGANALGMYNEDLFPFDAFSFHNVSCRTQIYYGAYYKAWIQLYMNSNWQTNTAQTIIGSGGLFEITDSSGYIIKELEDTTYATNTMLSNASFTTSNQFITQREKINIYGSFKDNAISLTVMGQSVSTSTSLPLPIGFIAINVMSGTGTLSSNSYRFLPGSSLFIAEGATVNVSSSVKAVFYDEKQYVYSYKSSSSDSPVLSSAGGYGYIYLHRSKYGTSSNPYAYGGIYDSDNDFEIISGYESNIIVNGTLNCSGYLAGRINTTGENGKVVLAYNSYTFNELSSLTYGKLGSTANVASTTKYPKLKLYSLNGVASNYTNAGSGTYFSIKDSNNNYGFYTTSGTLSYNVNGGSGSFSDVSISISSSGHTITASEVANTPTRNHYNFGGWYLESNCTTPAQGSVVYCSCTLYAKWTPKNYNIVYDFDQLYDGSATNGTETNNANNPSTYNYESSFALYNPTYGDYVFDGWYFDSSYTTKISSVIGSNVVESLSSPNYVLTLYGRWYPAGTTTYVITYHNDNEDEGCTCIDSEEIISSNLSSYNPPSLGSKNTNSNYDKYFDGWYLDSQYQTKYTSNSQITGSITMYAKWYTKNTVHVCYNYDNAVYTIETRYLEANRSFTIPDISSYVTIATGYTVRWDINGGDLDGNSYSTGDTICLSTGWDNEIFASATIVPQQFSLSITCGSNESLTYTVYVGSTTTVRRRGSGTTNGIDVYTDDKVSVTVTASSGYSAGAISTTNMTGSNPYYVSGAGNPTISVANAEKASCLIPSTLVTMADGTQREIQYLVPGDMVVVFNHETGMLDIAPVTFNEYEEAQWFNVIHLLFDNGSDIGVISEHGFFDLDTMKYEYIDESNYQDFIGHRFYTINGTSSVLTDAYVASEYTMCYSLPTYYHLNLFTEGILSMPGGITGLFNYFDYADNLQYDQDKMEEDINTYGLFTIEEFEPYGVTEEMFNAYAGKYLKVALGKGILTEEYLMYLVERYSKYTE